MKLFELNVGTNPRQVRTFLTEKGIDIPALSVRRP